MRPMATPLLDHGAIILLKAEIPWKTPSQSGN